MVFSSTSFIFFFLPIVLFFYYLVKNNNFKNYWLLLSSLIFFSWAQPRYLWIILFNIVINYSCAVVIDRLKKNQKLVLIFAVIANIGVLYYFKYFDFTILSVNKLLGTDFVLKGIILPIGISFFTFQGLSYVIDVYRKDISVQKNIAKVALYITMFPQLVAGPIVRYKDIEHELTTSRNISVDDFSYGIQRFIIGLGKKVLIANPMAEFVDSIWSGGVTGLSSTTAWVTSIAYTLQIYFDFSGYSDMAIGLGRMFGFKFNENFNLPYVSKSISEFWRRWHISLCSWLKDYVYIPLGGNRTGNVYIHLSIVFLLTGIWHGAAWHFILWGIWNGLFVVVERFVKSKQLNPLSKFNSFVSHFIKNIYALCIINFGWVLFRAPNIHEAKSFILSMLGVNGSEDYSLLSLYMDRGTLTMLVLGIIFSSSLPSTIGVYLKEKFSLSSCYLSKSILLLFIFFISIIQVISGSYNPFIYFQF
ncbi:MAG: MBOAT family O-acyltransferase [Succinivibrio sp.]